MPFSPFIEELRRRRVFRVAAFYGGIAFVIVQIIDGTFDLMGVPQWVGRVIVTLLALGFPVSMILAWVFDITPEGIVRTSSADESGDYPVIVRKTLPMIGNRALIVITILAVAFGTWGWMRDGGGNVEEIRSIAVLPLVNLMNDADQDYFVDGMHDLLITELSKVRGLRVISRNSTAHYKDSGKHTDAIAAELGVDAIVEGSVFRGGDQVRINAQLIGMNPERHLWAEAYDRKLINIFALQREIAQTVASQIGLNLGGNSGPGTGRTKVVNPSSFDAYARGRQLWQRRTGLDVVAAIELFIKAINLDSTNALAWAGLADAYVIAPEYAYWSEDSSYILARLAANRALALEPTLAQPHATLGMATIGFKEGSQHFDQALALDPNYATSYHWYGNHLEDAGQLDAAMVMFKQAALLDPHSLAIHGTLVEANYLLGDYEQYLKSAVQVIAEKGPHPYYSFFVADALLLVGETDSALVMLEELDRIDFREATYVLATTYAAMGDVVRANAYMQKFAGKTLPEHSLKFVVYFSRLGDLDQSIERLEMFLQVNDPVFALRLRHDPRARQLVKDPRFEAMLRKYGVRE